MTRDRVRDLRRRIYLILEQGGVGDGASRMVDRLLMAVIVVNLVAVALESVPEYSERYGAVFGLIEDVSLVVFTVEYVLRLWAAPEHLPYHRLGATRARVRYALSAAGLVDLIAVLPFWFAFLVPSELRVLQVFRMTSYPSRWLAKSSPRSPSFSG